MLSRSFIFSTSADHPLSLCESLSCHSLSFSLTVWPVVSFAMFSSFYRGSPQSFSISARSLSVAPL